MALKNVVGAYAIAILEKSHPDQLVCARKGSPLIVGVGTSATGRKEFFLGSDATPIIEYTKDVVYLKDEEIVKQSLFFHEEAFTICELFCKDRPLAGSQKRRRFPW